MGEVDVDGAGSSEAERLRRRLYSPDVTDEDVEAYRAAAPEEAPAPTPTLAPAPVARSVSRRARLLTAIGAALLVATAVVLVVTLRPLAPLTATRTADPTPSAAPGAGQVRVDTADPDRRRFVRSLQLGDSAGLLDYLAANPSTLPPAIRTLGRAASTEYSGQGPSTIELDPSATAQKGGRLTVILVTDRASTFSWAAERVAQRNDRSGPVVTVASHAGAARLGEPVSTTVAYGPGAPVRLEVYLDETVKWGAVVDFTD